MCHAPHACRTVLGLRLPRECGGPDRGEDSFGVNGEDQENWGERGVCRTADPDELFVDGAAQNRAKALCTGCPVRTECLAHALDHRIEHGIWGGMTERERRALLRRRPTVTSWRRLLETARAEYGRQSMTYQEPSEGASQAG
ncbi:WhiB family transcriptional regulator [Streptomyces broussonetiae]|uniref:WhiB family transcriptional regulator n=1 Tax=Streptomyces broussonetiae TaxID=2686304 RepID=UPI0035DE495C